MPARQERLDRVAPLDEQDPALCLVVELEVEDVLDPLEPIDVGVDDRAAAPIGTRAPA